MLHQVVEIYGEDRYLSLERGFLKINEAEKSVSRVPLDDIAVLLLTARSTTLSKNILNELAGRGTITVLCGKNYLPFSMVVPVSGHYLQTGIIKAQIDSSVPFTKNIWKRIVEEKLLNQAKSLAFCNNSKDVELLKTIAKTVKSGDSDNREAYGAKVYWKALFGKDFIRDKDGDGINALLNYGYAVVRASVARAICSAGLMPSLGVYHSNQLNPFCLADDLFEPFRPLVDVVVYQLAKEKETELNPDIKEILTDVLWTAIKTSEGVSPLFQALHYMCSAYVKALRSKKAEFDIPLWEGKNERAAIPEEV
jgi:CRISPR-associated protein Cas1